jgi:hypothetical protein
MNCSIDLTRTNRLSARLNALSREQFYDVYRQFDWPEGLDRDRFAMSPELSTLAGTPLWDDISDEQKWRLTITETGNLFSNTLNGERILVAGLTTQLYSKPASDEITDYLHHFLDEENKHMIMFGLFCRKYVGRVYPSRSFGLPQKFAPGEELLRFFTLAMVVEEISDQYNARVMNDDRCDPLVRAISHLHHVDERRHLAFDRAYLIELAGAHLPHWDDSTIDGFRSWLSGFIKSFWLTFYNPSAYRDAGIDEPYEVQQLAMAAPAQRALREELSAPTVKFLMKTGLLAEPPAC